MKICKKCGTEKPLSEFYKRKSTLDGYRNQCKKCSKEYDVLNKIKRNYTIID